MPKHILIIEDEPAIQTIIKEVLEEYAYKVDVAKDGIEGLKKFRVQKYDLILLDIMLPKIDGYSVCEIIREESNLPIIMLTAMEEEEDQIKAFDLKVDDYITKPFSIKLLVKRVEAVLRRWKDSSEGKEIINYKDIQLNLESFQIFVNGVERELTRKEFQILQLFLENQGHVFTRAAILNQVWGYDFWGDEKIVNIHIMNIRKKTERDYIDTVRGVGYRLDKEN